MLLLNVSTDIKEDGIHVTASKTQNRTEQLRQGNDLPMG